MNTVNPERVFRAIALILSQRHEGITVTLKSVKKITQEAQQQ